MSALPVRVLAVAAAAVTIALAPQALAMSIQEVPNPRARGSWIADTNDMIDAATEARLDAAIDAFEKEGGTEIAVVCVESVDTPSPKDFATQLFNLWGIGKAGKDDGLLVLMVRGERRLEMETGYGLEPVLTDGWLKVMQQDEMVPFFKAGDYGAGLEAGVRASIARLRQYPDGVPAGAEPPRRITTGADRATHDSRGGFDWSNALVGGFVLLLGGGGLRLHLHRRERTCPRCKVLMQMVPEHEDDEQLDEGQRLEEGLGTTDHQLYRCERCDFDRHIKVDKWFSGHCRCGRCGYKTAVRTTFTLVQPTYDSTGLAEVTVSCKHCHHDEVTQRTIPRLTRSSSSSSSSSSGGSSFGGGSSGGGGAGSSW